MPHLYRRLTLACAASLILHGAALAEFSVEDLTEWADKTVEVGDWTFVGVSDTAVTYARKAPGGANRIWTRWEYKEPKWNFRSMLALQDVDCAEARTRTLQRVGYSGNNMTGSAMSGQPPPSWSYSVPGTIGASTQRFACGN